MSAEFRFSLRQPASSKKKLTGSENCRTRARCKLKRSVSQKQLSMETWAPYNLAASKCNEMRRSPLENWNSPIQGRRQNTSKPISEAKKHSIEKGLDSMTDQLATESDDSAVVCECVFIMRTLGIVCQKCVMKVLSSIIRILSLIKSSFYLSKLEAKGHFF